jgi:SpoVK/Ycf46/Vps4 family AAA+-type ATPase
LERRISLIVKFPKPNAKHRLDIWKSLIPKKLPLHDDVSLEALAEEFDLTGGIIKNVVLNAARLAAADDADKVSFDHFLEAIKGIEEGKSGFEQKSKSPTTRGRMVTTADIDRPSSR